MTQVRPKVGRAVYDTTPVRRAVVGGNLNAPAARDVLDPARKAEWVAAQKAMLKAMAGKTTATAAPSVLTAEPAAEKKPAAAHTNSNINGNHGGENKPHLPVSPHREKPVAMVTGRSIKGFKRDVEPVNEFDPQTGPVTIRAGHSGGSFPPFARPSEGILAGRSNMLGMPVYAPPVVASLPGVTADEVPPVPPINMAKLGQEVREQLGPVSSLDDADGDGDADLGGASGRVSAMSGVSASSRPSTALARINTPQRVGVNHPDLSRGPHRLDRGRTLDTYEQMATGTGLEAAVAKLSTSTSLLSGTLSARKPVRVPNPENNGSAVPAVQHVSQPQQAPQGGQRGQLTLKDYATLALACRRSGRIYHESLAYYNMAVIHDNAEQYQQAIKCYKKYAQISKQLGNVWGEALAYNNIGVDYLYLGPGFVALAIDYHTRHLEITSMAGKFIARTNLGLCYMMARDDSADALAKAKEHFHVALRYAVRMSNKEGESMVVANLALAERRFGDLNSSRVTTQRQLSLASSVGDRPSERDARARLGEIANATGSFNQAANHFQDARNLAAQTGDRELAEMAQCNLGIAEGHRRLTQFMNKVASAITGEQPETQSNPKKPQQLQMQQIQQQQQQEVEEMSSLIKVSEYPKRGQMSTSFPPTTLLYSPKKE